MIFPEQAPPAAKYSAAAAAAVAVAAPAPAVAVSHVAVVGEKKKKKKNGHVVGKKNIGTTTSSTTKNGQERHVAVAADVDSDKVHDHQERYDGVIQNFNFGTTTRGTIAKQHKDQTSSSSSSSSSSSPSVSSSYSDGDVEDDDEEEDDDDEEEDDESDDDDDDEDEDENDGVIRHFKCKPQSQPWSSSSSPPNNRQQWAESDSNVDDADGIRQKAYELLNRNDPPGQQQQQQQAQQQRQQQQQKSAPAALLVPIRREVVDDKGGRVVEHFKCSASHLHYEHERDDDDVSDADEEEGKAGKNNENDDDISDVDDDQDGVIVHVKYNAMTASLHLLPPEQARPPGALSPPSLSGGSSSSEESSSSSDDDDDDDDADNNNNDNSAVFLSPPSICDPLERSLSLYPPSICDPEEHSVSLSPPSISEPEELSESLSPPSISDPQERSVSLSPPSICDPEEHSVSLSPPSICNVKERQQHEGEETPLSPPSITDVEEQASLAAPSITSRSEEDDDEDHDGVIENYKLVMVPRTDDDDDDNEDRSYSYYYAEGNERHKSITHPQQQQQEYVQQQQEAYNEDSGEDSQEDSTDIEFKTKENEQEDGSDDDDVDEGNDDDMGKDVDLEHGPRHNDSRRILNYKQQNCDSTSPPSYHSSNSINDIDNSNSNNNNDRNDKNNNKTTSSGWCPSCWTLLACSMLLALLCGITGTVFGVINFINAQQNDAMGMSGTTNTASDTGLNGDENNATTTRISTLAEIYNRGTLHCGLPFVNSPGFLQDVSDSPEYEHDWVGMDIELCKAISAAIFGTPNFVSVTMTQSTGSDERWTALASKKVDLVLRSTHTMQRDVYMAEVGTGYAFSQPYFYDGLMFGGIPEFTICAENQNTTGSECELLRICVDVGTTHYDVVRRMFPQRHVRPVSNMNSLFASLSDETCNVIAWESHGLTPTSVALNGYTNGPYQMGTRYFSREPLAIATRQDDTEWTDFVFWTLQALLTAEEHGITQATAVQAMPTTKLFGERFQDMFRNAVGASGSYGEIYR
jgi:general L-amino acid transport system substrate-binding protein